jgi:hypothetical protein
MKLIDLSLEKLDHRSPKSKDNFIKENEDALANIITRL